MKMILQHFLNWLIRFCWATTTFMCNNYSTLSFSISFPIHVNSIPSSPSNRNNTTTSPFLNSVSDNLILNWSVQFNETIGKPFLGEKEKKNNSTEFIQDFNNAYRISRYFECINFWIGDLQCSWIVIIRYKNPLKGKGGR